MDSAGQEAAGTRREPRKAQARTSVRPSASPVPWCRTPPAACPGYLWRSGCVLSGGAERKGGCLRGQGPEMGREGPGLQRFGAGSVAKAAGRAPSDPPPFLCNGTGSPHCTRRPPGPTCCPARTGCPRAPSCNWPATS